MVIVDFAPLSGACEYQRGCKRPGRYHVGAGPGEVVQVCEHHLAAAIDQGIRLARAVVAVNDAHEEVWKRIDERGQERGYIR